MTKLIRTLTLLSICVLLNTSTAIKYPLPVLSALAPQSTTSSSAVETNSSCSSSLQSQLTTKEEASWRTSLPTELRDRATLHRVMIDGYCEVYLLGTSHVSHSSCDDVKALMEHVKPDCLFIELCPQRTPILTPPPSSDATTKTKLPIRTQLQQLKQSGMSHSNALSTILLTKVQSDYATKLNITVGAEFQMAYESARQTKSRVILGDRPFRLTLLRAWESLGWWGKTKFVMGLLWSCVRQPSDVELKKWMDDVMKDKEGDVLTKSIKEMGRHFPMLVETIITERDEYMYAKLRQTARLGARTIVAVVGAGHCPGILKLSAEGGQMENAEDILRRLVETRRWKIEGNPEMMSLITDVIELNMDS